MESIIHKSSISWKTGDYFTLTNKLITELDDYLVKRISELPELKPVIQNEYRAKGIFSLFVDKKDFHNERFIKRISEKFAVSTGSACSLGEPSHVISAIGEGQNVNKIIRISLNKYLTKTDVDEFIECLHRF